MLTRRKRIKPKKKIDRVNVLKLLVLPLLIVIFYVLLRFIFVSNYWNGKNKIVVVYPNKGDYVSIAVLDPKNSEFVKINIPGNTEIETSRNLGRWKIKSLWKLGENEGLDGNLLASSVTKHFKFPIFIWASEEFQNLVSDDIFSIIRSTFMPMRTNLSFSDRFSIAVFMLRLKNVDKTSIDLEKTIFLKKAILANEDNGYVLSGFAYPIIYSYFHEDSILPSSARITIVDGTDKSTLGEDVGKIAEVVGGKVVSIKKTEDLNFTCIVKSRNGKISDYFTRLFNCESGVVDDNTFSADVEIILGNKFEEIF